MNAIVSVNVLPSSQFATTTSIQQREDTYPAQAREGTGTVSLYATAQRGPFDKGGNSEPLADPHMALTSNGRCFFCSTTFQLGEIRASFDLK